MKHASAGGQDAAAPDLPPVARDQEEFLDVMLHVGTREGRQWRRQTNTTNDATPADLEEVARWLTENDTSR